MRRKKKMQRTRSRDIISNIDNVIFWFGLKMTEGNIT